MAVSSSKPGAATSSSKTNDTTTAPSTPKDLKSAQTELFHKSKYTDLTIRCNERSWQCHRAILCSRCPFFEAACGGQFLESESREIILKHEYPDFVEMFLLHLYTLEAPNFLKFEFSYRAAFNAVILGDQYLVDTLCAAGQAFLIARYQASCFIKWWENNDETWRSNSFGWIRQIFDAKQAGFKAVRVIAIDSVAKLKDQMVGRKDFLQLLTENKTFATELVQVLPRKSM